MVHVDIEVPVMGKIYEFNLNENVKILSVIEEIVHVIARMEKRNWKGQVEQLLLCNCTTQNILPNDKTLSECNVKDGVWLMLV